MKTKKPKSNIDRALVYKPRKTPPSLRSLYSEMQRDIFDGFEREMKSLFLWERGIIQEVFWETCGQGYTERKNKALCNRDEVIDELFRLIAWTAHVEAEMGHPIEGLPLIYV